MRMRSLCAAGLILALSGPLTVAAQETAPLAHWPFREGKGLVLGDAGGKGLNGKIVNAAWVKTAFGTGLRFDGKSAHVDCGTPSALALTGDFTLSAWVQLEATPFPNHDTNWNIIENEEYAKWGYMLRVDGASAKLCFRTNQDGPNQAAFSRGMLSNGVPYHVAVVRQGGQAAFFVDGRRDVTFNTNDPLPPKSPFRIGSTSQSFHGVIYDVRVYDRALKDGDLLALFAQDAPRFAKDVSWMGTIGLTPFLRQEERTLIVEADFRGIMPLPPGANVTAVLASQDGREIVHKTISDAADALRQDVVFDLNGIAAGEYAVTFACHRDGKDVTNSLRFTWPPAPPAVRSPAEWTAPALPTPAPPPACEVKAYPQGGLALTVDGKRIRVESRFGRPGGGWNTLAVGAKSADGDPVWKVTVRRGAPDATEITSEGRDYRIERRVSRFADRVVITDTFVNRLQEPVGIPFLHRVGVAKAPVKGFVSGYGSETVGRKEQMKTNPTIFLKLADLGVGLVALDDVFIVQSTGGFDAQGAEFGSREFALDAGASATLEWAVYFNATGDYYDFINAVRRDEGRNFVTVRGGFAGAWDGGNRRFIPPKEHLELRGAKYVLSACLSHIPDDPQISLEGIEFMEYPQEKALLREQMLGIRAVDPDAVPMFHVAHSLYATPKPEQTFPDSRVILADGSQATWEDPAFSYISRERHAQNWRWWIYYPTLENSFGKALLRSADVMVDELGCRAVFMDGFMWAYRGEYTYDHWDGRTADLDPNTHRILRKKASVLLASQPALVAFVERMASKGAVVIGNNTVVTRTIGKLDILVDKEITEGPDVHLAQTPITMGNPAAIQKEFDVYHDVLAKLRWGNLYMYYGEGKLTYPSVPQQMYPITVQEIGEGIVRGKERIVTTHSGVYGWPGERDLHFAYRYDARGHRTQHAFTTTADSSGVRTYVTLGPDETAVVKRIPLSVAAEAPVNLIVTRYDAKGMEVSLNAEGRTEITVRSGDFAVAPKTGFTVRVGDESRAVTSDDTGILRVSLEAKGAVIITMAPLAP